MDGTDVAESPGGGISAPLATFSSEVFLLDLGWNRYVMTRAETLAPLLDLPPARVEVERGGERIRLSHVEGPALGIVVEDARPYEAPGWVVLSDNVVDLLPGESRELGSSGPAEQLRVEGWNVRC